jgi:MoaA/NifB/PqqE/SkfB family radical SAM enzyme
MCPYTALAHSGPANRMSENLYRHVLRELARVAGTRLITPMLMNEPLLDPGLPARVRQAREILGRDVLVTLVTNALLLTESRAAELFRAGLDSMEVSVDALTEETYRSIRPGLDFATVVRNTQAAARLAGRGRLAVRLVRQCANEHEIAGFRRFWRSRGVRVRFHAMVNRAGALEGFAAMRARRRRRAGPLGGRLAGRLVPCCLAPFTRMAVLWDGRALVCCNDWRQEAVVGDLSRQKIEEVWNGEAMNHYRHVLWQWRPDRSPLCADCSLVEGVVRA